MEFYLEKVSKEDKNVLYRLLQYSLFEESESDLNDMNSEALFEYKWFDSYFCDDNKRDAYFIKDKETNKLLGFAMVNSFVVGFECGHSIAEFMVIPKYRRNKIGKNVAFKLFDEYKGNWEVKPSYNSEKAYCFWKHVVKEYTGDKFVYEDGMFMFTN